MILQYKYKKNWCYTEAETITVATVFIGDLLKWYNEAKDLTWTGADGLSYLTELQQKIESRIITETHCSSSEIIYHSSNTLDQMSENIKVVSLLRQDQPCTHIFDGSVVYILNNSGKTVQKIN